MKRIFSSSKYLWDQGKLTALVFHLSLALAVFTLLSVAMRLISLEGTFIYDFFLFCTSFATMTLIYVMVANKNRSKLASQKIAYKVRVLFSGLLFVVFLVQSIVSLRFQLEYPNMSTYAILTAFLCFILAWQELEDFGYDLKFNH